MAITWKVAAAGGAALGLGIGGFALNSARRSLVRAGPRRRPAERPGLDLVAQLADPVTSTTVNEARVDRRSGARRAGAARRRRLRPVGAVGRQPGAGPPRPPRPGPGPHLDDSVSALAGAALDRRRRRLAPAPAAVAAAPDPHPSARRGRSPRSPPAGAVPRVRPPGGTAGRAPRVHRCPPVDAVPAALVMLAGCAVQGAVGFGANLVAAPLLVLIDGRLRARAHHRRHRASSTCS